MARSSVKNTFSGAKLVAAIEVSTKAAVDRVARRVFGRSQVLVPVDTGELKDSGQIVPGPDEGTVFIVYDAPHAGFVEEGTLRMPARSYLRAAVFEEEVIATRIFTAAANLSRVSPGANDGD